MQALIGASQQSTQVAGLFSAFTANDPQLAVDIDREKARSLGLPISEITERDADLSRVGLRERLRLQQPRVSRLRAGGQGLPLRSERPRRSTTRGPTDGRDGAAGQRRPRARDDGAAGDQPLQPVPLGAGQRRGGARRQLRPGAGRNGAAGRRRRCRRASATRGRASRSRRSRPAGSRPRSSASPCCSST